MGAAGSAPIGRGYFLAERQDAIDEMHLLDAEVEQFIARARQRRRVLLRRARRMGRMSGLDRAIDDAAPWWDAAGGVAK